MSFIINKPSPPGSAGKGPTITFDNAFSNYGDTTNLFDREIRTDLLRELFTTTQSASYSRSSGVGVDMYENESLSDLTKITLRLEIVAAVDRYNNRVPPQKKVLISQEGIDFGHEDGVLYINILYIQEKDLQAATSGSQIIKNIVLPVG